MKIELTDADIDGFYEASRVGGEAKWREAVEAWGAARLAEAQRETWDECCKAFGWAIDNGTNEQAIQYVWEHNPYAPREDT